MKIINKIVLFLFIGATSLNSNQSIVLEVEFDQEEIDYFNGVSSNDLDIQDNTIYFGFSPGIFSGFIPPSSLNEENLQESLILAQRCITSRKMSFSKNKLYSFHMELEESAKNQMYLLTVTALL